MSIIKGNIRKTLSLLLMAVFVISTGLFLRQIMSISRGAESYDRAQAIAASGSIAPAQAEQSPATGEKWIPVPVEGDENMETLAAIDLQALREENPDVIGWIMIPGTRVNYPIVQGEDNEHYLKHTWDGVNSGLGSIFMETQNSSNLTDYNTIIYGHNISDGSMFSVLKEYGSPAFCEEHPYIYILTDEGAFRYEVFAGLKADVDSIVYYIGFAEKENRAKFLLYSLDNSYADTGIIPGENDRILTLSTCTGGGYSSRWVVQARLEMMEV